MQKLFGEKYILYQLFFKTALHFNNLKQLHRIGAKYDIFSPLHNQYKDSKILNLTTPPPKKKEKSKRSCQVQIMCLRESPKQIKRKAATSGVNCLKILFKK